MARKRKRKRNRLEPLPDRSADYTKAIETFATGVEKTYVPGPLYRGAGVTPRRVSLPERYVPGSAEAAEREVGEFDTMIDSQANNEYDPADWRTNMARDQLVGEANKLAGDRRAAAKYKRTIEQMKTSGALQTRPSKVPSGVVNASGGEVYIPETWDADHFRVVVKDLIISGAGGATGGQMSIQEAVTAAAGLFRGVHGDERNWDTGGMTRDRWGAPITTELSVQSKRRAIAAETARVTGRPQPIRGQLGYMLPDQAGREQRKLLDAIDAAAAAKGKDKGKLTLTATERAVQYDIRGIYFSDRQPSKEEVEVITAFKTLQKALKENKISLKEFSEKAVPLEKRLSSGSANKSAVVRKAQEAQHREARRAQRIERAKIVAGQAAEDVKEATGEYDAARKEAAALKKRLKELKASRDPEADPSGPVDPDFVSGNERIDAEIAEVTVELEEVTANMAAGKKAVAEAKAAYKAAQAGTLRAHDFDPTPSELGGGAANIRHYQPDGLPADTDATMDDPNTGATKTLVFNEVGRRIESLARGTILHGKIPLLSAGEVGYNGDDGKAPGTAEVVKATAQVVTLRLTDAKGKKLEVDVGTDEIDDYYGPEGIRPPRAVLEDPQTGMQFRRRETDKLHHVLETSSQWVTMGWLEDGVRMTQVFHRSALNTEYELPGEKDRRPTREQAEADARYQEVVDFIKARDGKWKGKVVERVYDRVLAKMSPAVRSEVIEELLRAKAAAKDAEKGWKDITAKRIGDGLDREGGGGLPAIAGKDPPAGKVIKHQFPTNHPAVKNKNGSESNARLATVGSFDFGGAVRHYVIPTTVDGKKLSLSKALKIAKKHGLDRYPNFKTVNEAEAWIEEWHDKIAVKGSGAKAKAAAKDAEKGWKDSTDEWYQAAAASEWQNRKMRIGDGLDREGGGGLPAIAGKDPPAWLPIGGNVIEHQFPTNHPAVKNKNGSESNARLATVGSFDFGGAVRHYVIPTTVDGKKLSLSKALKIAKKHGLDRYPNFKTVNEAEAWIEEWHDKIAVKGSGAKAKAAK